MNHLYKSLIISLLIISSIGTAYGQKKLKYKDVFETVVSQKKEIAYTLLLEYQKQDPEFINTYYQLGTISYFWAKDYDPFLNRADVEFFIYNTKLFFGLAKGKLQNDNKDVRRNRKFYQNISILPQMEDIEYEDVIKHIDNTLSDISTYEKNVNLITRKYNTSVSHYNNCISIFKEINKSHNKLKAIYLTSVSDIKKTAKNLSLSYDSAIYYFQEYKTAINSYPIKNYNQTLQIRPIETYRLEGLTGSDFLLDTIFVWDYGKWVKELITVIDKNLGNLREEINTTNKKISDKTNFIKKNPNYSDSNQGITIPDKLYFTIEKFDYNSLISALFQYRVSKINYWIKSKRNFNNPKDSVTDFNFNKRIQLYYELLSEYRKTDSLLTIFEKRIEIKNYNKYSDFIDANYNKFDGLKQFTIEESSDNQDIQNNAYKNMGLFLKKEIKVTSSDSTKIEFKGAKIPFFKQYPDLDKTVNKEYYTLAINTNDSKEYYISGFVKNNEQIQPFLLKTDQSGKPSWLKTISAGASLNQIGTLIKCTKTGCFAMIYSKTDNQSINTLYQFDNDGKQLYKQDMQINSFPRIAFYDEINENIFFIYKGNTPSNWSNESEKTTLQKYSVNQPEKSWSYNFDLKGNVFDIVKMDTIYFVLTNFSEITTNNKMEAQTSKTDKSSNIACLRITQSGEFIGINPYYSKQSFFGYKAIKLNSELINILGFPTTYQSEETLDLKTTQPVFYGLIKLNGELIFSNTK